MRSNLTRRSDAKCPSYFPSGPKAEKFHARIRPFLAMALSNHLIFLLILIQTYPKRMFNLICHGRSLDHTDFMVHVIQFPTAESMNLDEVYWPSEGVVIPWRSQSWAKSKGLECQMGRENATCNGRNEWRQKIAPMNASHPVVIILSEARRSRRISSVSSGYSARTLIGLEATFCMIPFLILKEDSF